MSERETAYMNTFEKKLKKKMAHLERKARLNKKNGHLIK